MNLQAVKEYLESPEGIAKTNEYVNKVIREREIKESQLDRFHKDMTDEKFDAIVRKIETKYNSDEYKDKWYSRACMPPEPLLFFLHEYAERFGKFVNYRIWNIHGWNFEMICGQGCFIDTWKD